jgi:hypothetical protein
MTCHSCSKERKISTAREVLKGLTQRSGIDWPDPIWERWISLEHLFGRNEDVQGCLDIIAKRRQIEEEKWRKFEEERRRQIEDERREAWSSGYQYGYQQVEENTVQTHTQGAIEVDALTPAAGNRGVKREREEENIGVKDSPPKRAKTIEESPSTPVTTLTPGSIEAQAQPAEPLKR